MKIMDHGDYGYRASRQKGCRVLCYNYVSNISPRTIFERWGRRVLTDDPMTEIETTNTT